MIKLLLGGSPCTHWSIAQKNNRETEPSGLGWELFKNYLIAKEKYQPDYFLYENNKSASQAIKDQISKELGQPLQYINSALVSAQNRQRFYCHNIPNVPQPTDRGILLRDVLESGCDLSQNDKSYCLTARYQGAVPWNTLERSQRTMVIEPIKVGALPRPNGELSNSQAMRIYSVDGKSVTQSACGGGLGGKTGLYAVPLRVNEGTKQGYVDIAPGECVDLGMESSKTRCGRKMSDKSNCLTTQNQFYEYCGTVDNPLYRVENEYITIKGKQYPIKLKNGYYIIRKLSVLECKRLQTVPDDYIFPVSKTQAYKQLGNGWTVDVIAHILSYIPNIQNEEVEVLSMYDGMSCGHIALDKLGVNVVRYYATEIDKYAIQTTMANYPNTIQLGDAFQVREDDWSVENAVLRL